MLTKLFSKTKSIKTALLKALTIFFLSYSPSLHFDNFGIGATETSSPGIEVVDTIEGFEDKLAEVNQIYGYDDDIFLLLEEQTIPIASRRKEKASRAPSIVTVITEEEISNMGARRLTAILVAVP